MGKISKADPFWGGANFWVLGGGNPKNFLKLPKNIVVPYKGGFVPLIVDMVDSVVSYDRFEEPAEEHRRFMLGVFDKIGFCEDHRAGILNLDVLLGSLIRS